MCEIFNVDSCLKRFVLLSVVASAVLRSRSLFCECLTVMSFENVAHHVVILICQTRVCSLISFLLRSFYELAFINTLLHVALHERYRE